MKKILQLIILLFLTLELRAQIDLGSRLLQQTPNCESVAFNSTQLITDYFVRSELDSLNLVLEQWKNFCGNSEPLFRARILCDITLNHFEEGQLADDTQQMDMISAYCDRYKLSGEINHQQIYEYYKIYLGYVSPNSDFDLTTVAWATALLDENGDLSPTEQAYCLLYANRMDEFWAFMKNGVPNGTMLQQSYNAEVARVQKLWDGHLSLFTGAFIPQSNLNEFIGAKAIIGFQLGAKVNKMQYDLGFALRGGEAKQAYQVVYEGQLVNTTDHFSGYIGLDFARELTNNYKTELDFLWGIGVDVMDVIRGDTDEYDDSKTLTSYNFNLGFGYRFYLKNMNYIGLHAKYNLVNYRNKGGTNLGGNYISIGLSYDLFGNPEKHKQMKQMNLN